MGFHLSQSEYQAYVRGAQRQEWADEVARRTTERWRVFISYSHADKAHRVAVEEILKRRHVSYMIDAKDIEIGDEIGDWALDKIRTCSHYLLILSKVSATAPWCIAEYSMARGADLATIVYMVDDVPIPPAISARIATRDLARLDEYFAKDALDSAAVDRFIEELVGQKTLTFDQYLQTPPQRSRWELRERKALETRQDAFDPLGLVDDYIPPMNECIWSIEALGSGRWRFEISTTTSRRSFYDVHYLPEVDAVVMEPRFRGRDLEPVAVRRVEADGSCTITKATGGVEEALHDHQLFGWHMSRDFWDSASARLLSLLEGGENARRSEQANA